MGNFSGTVTFITGASSGLGAALAREVAQQGGNVVLTARRQDRLESLATEIEKMDRRALAVACDVTQDGDLEQAVAKAIEMFGRIDYVVANAGFGVAGRFENLTMDDHRRQFETNVFGVLRTIQTTLQYLITSRGCLAIIGTVNSYMGLPRLSSYAMSKFAMHGLADSLRYELRPHGVSVVFIVPGFIETELRQVNRQGEYQPDAKDRIPRWLRLSAGKAARQIAKALFKRKREKIITFHAVAAVFLQRHVPGLVYMLISRFGMKSRRV
ncbi:MAG: SDR family oxidoreductase [Deltaproteobacteria bacterium]|nr:SDR family oxidoreductase [Deltaproteobacteria bacterium]